MLRARPESLMPGCISVRDACASMGGGHEELQAICNTGLAGAGGVTLANQYRHWCTTVQPGHVGIEVDVIDDWEEYRLGVVEAFREHWENLAECEGIRYAIGQIEVDGKGFYHMQVYSEWKTSLRVGEVAARWAGHYEQRLGTRDQARVYCQKKDTRVEELAEIGEWRSDPHDNYRESMRVRALRAITVDGMSPLDIARELPEVYFVHHNGIEALWKKLNQTSDSLFDYKPAGFNALHEDGG